LRVDQHKQAEKAEEQRLIERAER
jgi:hypothetical protein